MSRVILGGRLAQSCVIAKPHIVLVLVAAVIAAVIGHSDFL